MKNPLLDNAQIPKRLSSFEQLLYFFQFSCPPMYYVTYLYLFSDNQTGNDADYEVAMPGKSYDCQVTTMITIISKKGNIKQTGQSFTSNVKSSFKRKAYQNFKMA